MLRAGSREDAARVAALVLEELGISKTNIEKLHSLATSALQSVQPAVMKRLAGQGAPATPVRAWGPIVDGGDLPVHPFDPGAPKISADVPMLIGTCLNEFVNGTDNPERDTLTEQELSNRVRGRYQEQAADIIAAYRKRYPKESPFGLWAAISAAGPRQNAITQAERKAAQGGAPAYMYVYAWRTPMLGGNIGTFHASELTSVFDNATLCPHYSGNTSEALALSSRMGEAWANFARSGMPGHSALPHWPAYKWFRTIRRARVCS
jgi:para-nitrobenzyl esterase